MHICINGQSREVADKLTVAQLIAQLAINPLHVAVEVNQQIVPRARHEGHLLADGDRVEVVTLVGGG